MAEDEKTEGTEEQPAEETSPQEEQPAGEASAEEAQSAEEASPEEAQSAEEASPQDEQPPEEASAEEEQPAEETAAEEEQPAEETAAEDAAGEEPAADAPPEGPKGETDLPPGADLDPIALEPEAELGAEERARLEAEAEERARREAELTGDGEVEPALAAARAPAKMETGARYLATGKRKRSIARVTLTPGEGRIEVNRRALEEYFPRPLHQTMARQPLSATGYEGTVDVMVRVHGGGISGQAGAVRHGIARALTEIDPELRVDLKRRGFLTRDARVKERRKAGLKKARKRPQFSKR
jgi:small subunit ribosomal protein S9